MHRLTTAGTQHATAKRAEAHQYTPRRRHYLAEDRIKLYMYQLVKAMDHMHRNGIFHRDIKPENILIMDDCLKLADFGSCRGIYSKQPYTEYISTRWRALALSAGTAPHTAARFAAGPRWEPRLRAALLRPAPACCQPRLSSAEAWCSRHDLQRCISQVSSAGVFAHRRLLQLQDGYVGRGLRLL